MQMIVKDWRRPLGHLTADEVRPALELAMLRTTSRWFAVREPALQ